MKKTRTELIKCLYESTKHFPNSGLFTLLKKIYLSAEIIQNDFTHIDYMKRVHYGTFKLDSSITLIKACMGCSELYVP